MEQNKLASFRNEQYQGNSGKILNGKIAYRVFVSEFQIIAMLKSEYRLVAGQIMVVNFNLTH